MWKPDGWGVQARLGVLVPHADVGPESELQAMAPPGVAIHASRVPFGGMEAGGGMDPTIPLAPVRAFAEAPALEDAAELLAGAPLAAIGFGFTSSAYVVGGPGEAAMLERLERRTRGLPVVATGQAAVEALHNLGVERLALVHPPWFDAELDALGAGYFEAAGFDVVFHGSCRLPSDQQRIEPGELYDWVRAHVPDEASAVFVGGNGMRAVGVIDALESELGRPVATANQVLLWAMLRAGEIDAAVAGYGSLFSA